MASSSTYAFFHCHYEFQKFPFFCVTLCVLHALQNATESRLSKQHKNNVHWTSVRSYSGIFWNGWTKTKLTGQSAVPNKVSNCLPNLYHCVLTIYFPLLYVSALVNTEFIWLWALYWYLWAGERSRYSDCLRTWRSGNRIPVGGRDFRHLSRPVLVPTHPPVEWVLGLSRG